MLRHRQVSCKTKTRYNLFCPPARPPARSPVCARVRARMHARTEACLQTGYGTLTLCLQLGYSARAHCFRTRAHERAYLRAHAFPHSRARAHTCARYWYAHPVTKKKGTAVLAAYPATRARTHACAYCFGTSLHARLRVLSRQHLYTHAWRAPAHTPACASAHMSASAQVHPALYSYGLQVHPTFQS